MFSIVIPNYNKANILAVTIDSVLNQTFNDFEVLIIDDGSTDSSVELIGSYQDERIKLICQKNAGVASARNKGVKEATRQWVAFLDADDWWHPRYLESLKKAIEENSEANIVATNFIEKEDSANWEPKAWSVKQTIDVEWIDNLPERWLETNPFFTSSACFRRGLLIEQEELFPSGESYGEDLDVWFRLSERNRVVYIPQPLVAYRTDQDNSLTQSHTNLEDPPFIKRLEARAKALWEEDKSQSISRLNFVDHHRLTRARQAVLLGQRKKALELLFNTTRAIKSKRWWMTLFMIFFFSKHAIHSWQKKRKPEKTISQNV